MSRSVRRFNTFQYLTFSSQKTVNTKLKYNHLQSDMYIYKSRVKLLLRCAQDIATVTKRMHCEYLSRSILLTI